MDSTRIGSKFRPLLSGKIKNRPLVWLWGPLPLYLDFARRCQRNGLPIFPFITSPIEGARSLCGPELLMRWMVKYFGRDCIIAGNIEPVVIQMGRPDEIYHLCMAALAQGSQSPRGYILIPGCGIAPNVPTQNLLMLKKAALGFLDG